MTNTRTLLWQEKSIPKTENCEVVECSSCGNQTAVLKRKNVVDYTCPSCYSSTR